MKVNTWKNLDVEVEVNVSLEDCINELLQLADNDENSRMKILAIDGATKVMEKVTPEVVKSRLTREGLELVKTRLSKWIELIGETNV